MSARTGDSWIRSNIFNIFTILIFIVGAFGTYYKTQATVEASVRNIESTVIADHERIEAHQSNTAIHRDPERDRATYELILHKLDAIDSRLDNMQQQRRYDLPSQ